MTRLGLVGCGMAASELYMPNLAGREDVAVVACADLDAERARALADRYGVPRALGVDALLADPEVEVVLNLTRPAAHGEIALRALEAGKHVYNEKPLAPTLAEGRAVVERARAAGLRAGCAPDTFLGAGLATARRLLLSGAVGEPVAVAALLLGSGHEHWHPDPAFYYEPGGGPMLDMGVYYLTALVSLLGPVRRVSGAARAHVSRRTARAGPRQGESFDVHVPTHVAGVLEFASGPIGTITTSFDVLAAAEGQSLQVFGTAGSMRLPDPNTFGGPLLVWRLEQREWAEAELDAGPQQQARGTGLLDMIAAMRENRPHAASAELGLHVLEVMEGIVTASREGRHVDIESGLGAVPA